MKVLERTRKRLIHAISNDTDIKRMSQIEELNKTRLPEPCVYSVEELKESLIEVERDFVEGKGILFNYSNISGIYFLFFVAL